MAMTDVIIEAEGLRKVFRTKRRLGRRPPGELLPFRRSRIEPLKAVDGVSLEVRRGQIVGLLGPNGAGKTTLIKMLCGLLVPDGGRGKVLGYDIRREASEIRSSVSLVAPTADVGTDNNLTVRQNLEFWASVYGIPRREQGDRIDQLLNLVELKEVEGFWPMRISAGMRQRLAIARSLLAKNELVFLDEPTVKLDPDGARRVREFIGYINRNRCVTVILTTHLMYEAEELCSHILVLDKGKIVAQGSPTALKKLVGKERVVEVLATELDENVEGRIRALPSVTQADLSITDSSIGLGRIVIKTTDIDLTTEKLLGLMSRYNIHLEGIRSGEPTLEDVFFHLTGRGLV
jgi:ABC-2 type transport system ATP-binding protein